MPVYNELRGRTGGRAARTSDGLQGLSALEGCLLVDQVAHAAKDAEPLA